MEEQFGVKCSFCGRRLEDVNRIITGENGHICDECINMCHRIIVQDMNMKPKSKSFELKKPIDIYNMLNEHVIGQEHAKKVLSVAMYNHLKRINHPDLGLEKSNVLLVGPSGSGKTLLAETLAKCVDLPIAFADATSLTEAGYVGEDVENILLNLLRKTDFDKATAEKGIIYIDEIDKLSKKSDSPSITRDVSGEGVQQALLKIIEGTVANIPPKGGRKHPHQDYIQLDTKNILFICGGCFDGIDNIVLNRLEKKSIGFNNSIVQKEEVDMNVRSEDIIKYGIIPELVGRLPIISTLKELTKEELLRVLIEPKNSILSQYQELFEIDNIKLSFSDSVLESITEKAIYLKVGARGLRTIIEDMMLEKMFNIMSNEEKKELIIN